jgi:hypothetical protein
VTNENNVQVFLDCGLHKIINEEGLRPYAPSPNRSFSVS